MNMPNLLWFIILVSCAAFANDFDDWIASKKGRIWTSADGRQINARLISYDWTAKTVHLRKEDGAAFVVDLSQLSSQDNEFITRLATVPQLMTAEDVKARVLAYQKLDVYGNVSTYGGKSGRLLEEFKQTVREGYYDLEMQIEAHEWNAAEYRRVGDSQNAAVTDAKRSEVTLLKEQRDLQRRQIAAAEAQAQAKQEMAEQLKEIKRQIWMYRVGW